MNTDAGVSPPLQQLHQYVDKTFALSTCAFCNGVMMGTHHQCSECNIAVHKACKESMNPICGGFGTMN